MGSPTSLIERPETRVDRIRRERRENLGAFPHDPRLRWALRLGIALLIVLPAVVGAGSLASVDTPNQQLLTHLGQVSWDRADQRWIAEIFPPLSTLLAAAVSPLGRLGLSIVGALFAGVFLQKLLESMVQRRFPPSVGVVLLIALAVNPLFSYTANENLPALMGLAFFALGIADVARFVSWGSTQSGFRAGILFMLAVLSDGSAPLYVGVAALTAPFLSLRREGQRGVRRANLLVIVFPSVAALGSIVILNLIFLGRALAPEQDDALAGVPERLSRLITLFGEPGGWLLLASVGSAWLVSAIIRRPGALIISTLVFAAILAAFILGMLTPNSAGNTFILMTVMATALIPARQELSARILLLALATLQILIAWASALYRPILTEWIVAMNAALGIS